MKYSIWNLFNYLQPEGREYLKMKGVTIAIFFMLICYLFGTVKSNTKYTILILVVIVLE